MELSVSEQLMYSTVRIECILENGQISVGTGFFYKLHEYDKTFVPVIVTNKHVIRGAKVGRLVFTEADENGNPLDKNHIPIKIENFEQQWIGHPEDNIDLCIMPVARIINALQKINKKIFYKYLEKWMIWNSEKLGELNAIEDIIMIGYPNGLWDSVNNKPVARKGITATHPKNDYEGRPEIVIDAACYGGSSGSPVFILNEGSYLEKNSIVLGKRIIFLGILYAGPQVAVNGDVEIVTIPTTQTRVIARSMITMNLGFIIKAHKLFDFEPLLE